MHSPHHHHHRRRRRRRCGYSCCRHHHHQHHRHCRRQYIKSFSFTTCNTAFEMPLVICIQYAYNTCLTYADKNVSHNFYFSGFPFWHRLMLELLLLLLLEMLWHDLKNQRIKFKTINQSNNMIDQIKFFDATVLPHSSFVFSPFICRMQCGCVMWIIQSKNIHKNKKWWYELKTSEMEMDRETLAAMICQFEILC